MENNIFIGDNKSLHHTVSKAGANICTKMLANNGEMTELSLLMNVVKKGERCRNTKSKEMNDFCVVRW